MSFTTNHLFENVDPIKEILSKILTGQIPPEKDTSHDPDHDESYSVDPDDIGIHHGRPDQKVNEDEELSPKNKVILPPKPITHFDRDNPVRPAPRDEYDDLHKHYHFTNGNATRNLPKEIRHGSYSNVDQSHINQPTDGSVPEHHELHHIRKYTVSSAGLNKSLYVNHDETKSKYKLNDIKTVPLAHNRYHKIQDQYHKNRVSGIDSALSATKTPHDLTLYTGSGINPVNFKNRRMITHLSAYTSTSIDPTVAKDRASYDIKDKDKSGNYNKTNERHMMAIHWPEGSKGAYVAHISRHPGEREFILPRNIGLKYHKTTTHEGVHDGYYGKETYHYHIHEFYPVYGHKD